MAYRRKSSARRGAYRAPARRRSYSRGARARTRSRVRRAPARKRPVARKRYRTTSKPQVVTIRLVQDAGSNLSPYEQQLQQMREKTEPKKAKF